MSGVDSTGPVSPDALAAWLLLRDEGGYWTVGELGRELRPDASPRLAASQAGRWVSALLRRGLLAANPLAVRAPSYGVTHRCLAPAGYSVEPFSQPLNFCEAS